MRFILFLTIIAIFAIQLTLQTEPSKRKEIDEEKIKEATEILKRIGDDINGEISKHLGEGGSLPALLKKLVG
uniref:Uncharacterized protein n=1 Tax=Strongyloides stercoralis TaxID=6248 RepID=A0A0K0E4M6_STRER